MRLTPKDIRAIKDAAATVFGTSATVRLFGSRTDDQQRGGDIDLLIQYHQPVSRMELYQMKINFLVQLKKIIGEQKIDVLIDNGQQNNALFHEAYKNGILI